jgi:hypothetical protein
MGLWGSKQQKDINLRNPEPQGAVFISESAIDNIIKVSEQQQQQQAKSNNQQQQPKSNELDLRLLPDLNDKRIEQYEQNLIANFNEATKEVEKMFHERYQTVPVCIDLQKSVSECYKSNKDRSLNCLDIANQFVKCVEKERQNRFGLTAFN